MQTERPIFILGLQRGGTNQVLNILRSHPDTFWPKGEFHEVLRGRGLRRDGPLVSARKWLAYTPLRLRAGDVLNPDRPPAPDAFAGAGGPWVQARLAASAQANRGTVRAYKAALVREGFLDAGRIRPDRLLVKLVNYNVGLAPELARLYPQAVFVGLMRDAFGVCEGQAVRGASLAAATDAYTYVGAQLMAMEAGGQRLRTFRFEDLLEDTEAVVREIYGFCGLDATAARGICLQNKERVHDDRGRIVGIDKEKAFYAFRDVGQHMKRDANAASASRLGAEVRAEIADRCAPVLRHFGYIDPRTPEAPDPEVPNPKVPNPKVDDPEGALRLRAARH